MEAEHVASTTAGNDMIGALGAEIDRLEAEIQQLVPGIRHIDLVRFCSLLISSQKLAIRAIHY